MCHFKENYMQVDLKNRKLIKEWKKIENTDLFKSLEEFAEYYYANGEKFCYKKFTNEEWSQDNFFFGTYEELLEFYKTDTTIPYSAQQKVGQKFHSLTVLELFAENKTGKKVIYAKCKCDCGNDTIKILRDVVKGDACTCGCRTGGKEPKVSKPLTEEIIEFWDFDKNAGIDPYKISQMSTEKFWWKDKEGNSYQLAPYVFAKEDKTNSSFPEQALFYYIKKEYSSAINRANFITADGEVLEIDIYIPTYNIGIEYDGAYWHLDKVVSDTYKSNVLSENGIWLIRVRENGLSEIKTNDYIIEQSQYNSTNEKDFIDTINQVLDAINYKTNNIGREKITYESFTKIKNSIYALIYSKPVENSVKNTCIGQFWDTEMNGDLKPECVDIYSNIPTYFKCGANKSFKISANHYFKKLTKNDYKRYSCTQNYNTLDCSETICCPFSNLYICNASASCLYRKGYALPILKCNNKNIYKAVKKKDKKFRACDYEIWHDKIKASELNISFINKCPYPFSISDLGAFLVNKENITRLHSSYFSQVSRDLIIKTNDNYNFDFFITEEMQNKLPNNILIIYLSLFKEEYMRGWRFYIMLIVHFNEKGEIIEQTSKIASTTDFEGLLDFGGRGHCNLKMAIENILSL